MKTEELLHLQAKDKKSNTVQNKYLQRLTQMHVFSGSTKHYFVTTYILYLLNQTLQLLFISSHNFAWLLFESGYKSSVAFIKRNIMAKILRKCKGFEFYKISKKL